MPFSNVSTNQVDIGAYRDFVETFSDDLLVRGFLRGRTLELATFHPGVQGKEVLTQLRLQQFGRRYSEDFAPVADTVKFTPLVLEVVPAKFELRFVPQRFIKTYLGRKLKAFNDADMIPFEGEVLMNLMDLQAWEICESLWQAVAVTPALDTHNLKQIHNGYLKKITDALAAGSPVLTATPVPGGAWTKANIIETLETMWTRLDESIKRKPVSVCMKPNLVMLYQQAYREQFGKYTDNAQDGRVKLDFGTEAYLEPLPEMGSTNRVVMTQTANLHFGYDGVVGDGFNLDKVKRAIDYYYDFQMGCNFGFLEDGAVVVNDLA